MAPNVAAMFSYFTFIPAVIFLILKPYNKNLFVRFHALQSLFFNAGFFVFFISIYVLAYFAAGLLGNPAVLPLLFYFFSGILALFSLLCFFLWVVCLFKALQNERIKLPIIGELAEEQSSRGGDDMGILLER